MFSIIFYALIALGFKKEVPTASTPKCCKRLSQTQYFIFEKKMATKEGIQKIYHPWGPKRGVFKKVGAHCPIRTGLKKGAWRENNGQKMGN